MKDKPVLDPRNHPSGYYYGYTPTDATALPKPVFTAQPSVVVAVLILCAGGIHSWENGVARQLWEFGDEFVLGRIIRQVKEHGYTPTIITHRDDIRAATPELPHFEPEQHRTIAETWLYTRPLWGEQTVIFLGEVIHGNETIKRILAHRGPMQMIGNSAEIYAFTFPFSEHEQVEQVLYETNRYTGKGSPWEIYRHWCGVPYNQRGFIENKVFHWVWDRTCDLDSIAEYEGALGVLHSGEPAWKR